MRNMNANEQMKTIQQFQQTIIGPSGQVYKLNVEEYLVLKCHLVLNEDHLAIKNKKIKSKDLAGKYHDRLCGLFISFDGTGHNGDRLDMMFISWRDLMDFPMDRMLFGATID